VRGAHSVAAQTPTCNYTRTPTCNYNYNYSYSYSYSYSRWL
jgi:hypothetical protein